MKKVLHFGLSANLGGIETYLYKLTSNIDRGKFQFDFLILGDTKPPFYKELKSMGCNFHFITSRQENLLKNIKELRSVIQNEDYDIVHCHMNTLSYITPVLLSVSNKIPTIIHSRNAGMRASGITKILHKINTKILPEDKITKLAVSDYAGEWLFGKDNNIQIINNSVDVEKFKYNACYRQTIRNEFKISEDELVIIHTGAFRDEKNHDFILDIFREVYQIHSDSKLLLVGTGKLKEQIEKKIDDLGLNNNVIITGIRNDVSKLLSAADAFLFPSIFEGFPNSVIEAQTSGLPSVISDSITEQVVVNSNCKQLSLNDSAKDWAKLILDLTNKKKNRELAAENIKNSGFTIEDEVENISRIYKKLIK